MVRLLISLRATVTRHQLARTSRLPLVLAGIVGLAAAAGTLLLGFGHRDHSGAAGDVLSAVFALWLGGQLAQAALAGGESSLRPQIFALLPLPTRRLANSLLVVGLTDPVLVLLLVAYAALIPVGARSGPCAMAAAVVATILTTALTAILSTIAGGVLGPGARRGRDAGTILTALALSLCALAATLLPVIASALDHGRARWLSGLVRSLPSGWGANAVDAASRGHPVATIGWLGAIVALIAVAVTGWPRILVRRMSAAPPGGHPGEPSRRRRRMPATPTGAVTVKELRLWVRDPIRLTGLIIAVVVGLGVALIPRFTTGTGVLMPFAGPLTVTIAGACACNLYGNDGTSLWLTVVTPRSARCDIRGRQLAWATLVLPLAIVETVVLTEFSGQPSLWPWAVAVLLAVAGAAPGLFPVASLIAVQGLDDAGNPTPGWSIKINLSVYLMAATALPTLVVLIAAAVLGLGSLAWAAGLVAVVTSSAWIRFGSAYATRRLETTQVDVLRQLALAG